MPKNPSVAAVPKPKRQATTVEGIATSVEDALCQTSVLFGPRGVLACGEAAPLYMPVPRAQIRTTADMERAAGTTPADVKRAAGTTSADVKRAASTTPADVKKNASAPPEDSDDDEDKDYVPEDERATATTKTYLKLENGLFVDADTLPTLYYSKTAAINALTRGRSMLRRGARDQVGGVVLELVAPAGTPSAVGMSVFVPKITDAEEEADAESEDVGVEAEVDEGADDESYQAPDEEDEDDDDEEEEDEDDDEEDEDADEEDDDVDEDDDAVPADAPAPVSVAPAAAAPAGVQLVVRVAPQEPGFPVLRAMQAHAEAACGRRFANAQQMLRYMERADDMPCGVVDVDSGGVTCAVVPLGTVQAAMRIATEHVVNARQIAEHIRAHGTMENLFADTAPVLSRAEQHMLFASIK